MIVSILIDLILCNPEQNSWLSCKGEQTVSGVRMHLHYFESNTPFKKSILDHSIVKDLMIDETNFKMNRLIIILSEVWSLYNSRIITCKSHRSLSRLCQHITLLIFLSVENRLIVKINLRYLPPINMLRAVFYQHLFVFSQVYINIFLKIWYWIFYLPLEAEVRSYFFNAKTFSAQFYVLHIEYDSESNQYIKYKTVSIAAVNLHCIGLNTLVNCNLLDNCKRMYEKDFAKFVHTKIYAKLQLGIRHYKLQKQAYGLSKVGIEIILKAFKIPSTLALGYFQLNIPFISSVSFVIILERHYAILLRSVDLEKVAKATWR